MERGKLICYQLRELRKRIAEANGIRYMPEECTHEGPCSGTCPRCEAEVRYIEDALREKERRGEHVIVEGLGKDIDTDTPERFPNFKDDDVERDGDIKPLQGDADIPALMGIPALSYESNTQFAADILAALSSNYADRNLVFSPLGIGSMLEMLMLGVKPDDPFRHITALMLRGFEPSTFEAPNSNKVKVSHATGLWYQLNDVPLKPEFVRAMRNHFGTPPFNLNLCTINDAKNHIKAWARKNTNNMIEDLDIGMTHKAVLALADVLYMKAEWEMPFNPDATHTGRFTNADGSTARVNMMHLQTYEAYYESTKDYQAVELEYAGGDMSLKIVLPRKGRDLKRIMMEKSWLNIVPDDDLEIDLEMPKLRLESDLDLKDTLSSMGLRTLFEDDILTEMSQKPLHVDIMRQKCILSVDEEGTEAAAATIAFCDIGCLPTERPPRRHRMKVDRPFGFAVQDSGGTILFMGIVNHLDDVNNAKKPVQRPELNVKVKKVLTTVTVAGTSHITNIDDIADDIVPGTVLEMIHQKDNAHDNNAIALFLEEHRVGYIPKAKNEILANLLDADIVLKAIVEDVEWRGNWLHIKADIAIVE